MAINPKKAQTLNETENDVVPPEPVGDGYPMEEDISTPPEGSDQGHDEKLD